MRRILIAAGGTKPSTRDPSGGNLAMQRQHVGLEAVVEGELDHVTRLVLAETMDAAFGRWALDVSVASNGGWSDDTQLTRGLDFDSGVEAWLQQIHAGGSREGDADIAGAERDDKHCRLAGGAALELADRFVPLRGAGGAGELEHLETVLLQSAHASALGEVKDVVGEI